MIQAFYVITCSPTIDEHVKHIEKYINYAHYVWVKAEHENGVRFQSSVQYLEHEVSESGIKRLSSYVDKIPDWKLRKQAKASIIFGFLPIIIQELSLSARILMDICITHIYAY